MMVPSAQGESSPDLVSHDAPDPQASGARMHDTHAIGTPKMPDEPPFAQQSKKVAAHVQDES